MIWMALKTVSSLPLAGTGTAHQLYVIYAYDEDTASNKDNKTCTVKKAKFLS